MAPGQLRLCHAHRPTDTPLWVSGVIYQHGLRGLWYTFFAAWCAVSAFISTRIFHRSLAFSHAEWQSQRFGGLGGELMRGWVVGWQVFMNMFIAGWVGIAMGKVCEYLFDWPVWWGMVIFSSVCVIYTLAAWAGPHGVRVNAISPGGFRSREHKEPFLTQYCRRVLLERMAEHDDIKGVVVFLASEASRYLTGQNIIVDGGYSC